MAYTPFQNRVDCIIDRHNKMKAEKTPFMNMYQAIAYFVRARRMDFTSTHTPGQFLTGQIWDSTATQAAHVAASTYVGQIFPTPDKTIRIDAPYSIRKKQSAEVLEYFDEVTKRVRRAFSLPTAGFTTSYDEHWLDRVVFGMSGMRVENTKGEDEYTVPVRFRAVDAKRFCVAENASGFIDTIYDEHEMTVRQVVEEFSEKNVNGNKGVSKKVRDKYDAGKFDEKVRILHAVEPKIKHEKYTYGNKNMPIGSIHIDLDSKFIMRESGFEEMDTFISRFWKDKSEIYGRSPASELLPEIITLDGFSETLIEAAEKTLGPPVAALTDAISGGVVDLSANAVNAVIDSTGVRDIGGKVIEPIITVGDMKPTYEEKMRLKDSIYTGFSVDRLLDLNNETRMTLGEANIRNELRGQSLSNVYSREIAEVCYPMVSRVVNIMFAKGLLGVVENGKEHLRLLAEGFDEEDILIIPNEIAKIVLNENSDEEFFEITFISPAARILQQETILGIERTLEYAIRVQPIAPEVMDVINIDEVTRQIQFLTGAPSTLLRSPMEVEEIRQKREQTQQMALQLEAQKQQAETARAGGAAVQSVAKAAEGNQQQ